LSDDIKFQYRLAAKSEQEMRVEGEIDKILFAKIPFSGSFATSASLSAFVLRSSPLRTAIGKARMCHY
jgi:hypothetical protein